MLRQANSRVTSQTWYLLLLVCAVYCVINLGFPRLPIDGTVKSYLLQPVLWGLVAIVTLKLGGYRIAGKMGVRSSLFYLALMIGFAQVCFYAIGGLFSGYGKSPSSFAPLQIVENLFFVATTLAGMELSRAWLVHHLGKHTFLAVGGVSLAYGIMALPLSQVTGMKADVTTMSFASSTLLPTLAESLLATMLAYTAGAKASLAYRAWIQAFWWFCPILPNLSWSLKGMIGVITPIVGMAAAWNYYHDKTQPARVKRSSGGMPVGWILTAVAGVAIVWFAVGIFPFHPTLILTGSMRPLIEPGDVVIVAKTPPKNLKVGDIVEYRQTAEIHIVHRLTGMEDSQGQKLFITKGDANDSQDEPFPAENSIGKVVFTVPRVGLVSGFLKQLLQ